MSFGDKQMLLLSRCVDSINSYRDLVAEYLEGSVKDEGNAFVKKIALQYASLEKSVTKEKNVFNQIQTHWANNDKEFNCNVEKLFKDYSAQDSSTSNLENSEIFQRIVNRTDPEVQEIKKTNKTRTDDTQFESLNDSVQCAQVFAPPIDPISKTMITEPYKNLKCGHVYEYKFILEYIKKRGNKARCPIVGCRNDSLAVGHLKKDAVLEEKISQYLLTHNSEDDSDED